MKPPATVSPEEAVPSPTVPDKERKQLLALAAKGVTTDAAAKELGLTSRATLRYLMLLRVEGSVTLRATDDGRSAEWCRTTGRRKA